MSTPTVQEPVSTEAKAAVMEAKPGRAWRFPFYLLEPIVIPIGAIIVAFILFSIFLKFVAGADPIKALRFMYTGAFGGKHWQKSCQSTLVRAAPLMLTGLCVALPLRLGMVIIGGEGALVLGGLTAAGVAHLLPESTSPLAAIIIMVCSGMLAGGLWITLAGALKYYRGVNETISSLLLNYIAIAILNQMIEGPMHDPLSLNTPSTWPIPDANMISTIAGSEVHWGFAWGLIFCLLMFVLMNHTIIGFAARIAGGNIRAARVAGLAVGRLTLTICMLAGAAAGLAGVVEVAAIQGRANSNLTSPGYGYTGILVAFIARANPLAIIPVAILLGAIGSSNGVLQRRLHLPDATVLVLQGILFLVILASETIYGRFKIFRRTEVSHG